MTRGERGTRLPFSPSLKTPLRKCIAAALLIAALSARAEADTLTLGFFQSATDNLFQTAFPEQDQLSHLSFSFEKGFSPVSFFTQGTYSYLYRNTSMSAYAQEVGLDTIRAISGKTAFYIGVKAEGAIYRDVYRDYDFLSLGLAAAVKSYWQASSILKLNYNLDYRKYRLSIFDALSHYVASSLDRYFKSKTTLRGDLNWGYKSFFHPYAAEPLPTQEPVYPQGGGNGPGGGQMEPGRGLARSGPPSQSQGIQILSLSGLVAQGIGSRVGVRLSLTRQWTLSGENPFASIEEFYMIENPSYDVFSWNGYGLSGQVTVEIPWDIELKFGYTRSVKDFPGIEALDLEGVSIGAARHDTRTQGDIRLEKNFRALSLYLNYSYADNRSNDLIYNWRGHFLMVGVEWNLNWGAKE